MMSNLKPDNSTPRDRYLTVDEVADHLAFDRQTIWRWAREGTIPCYRIGTKFRFRLCEIDRWMIAKRQQSRLLQNRLNA